MGNLDNDFDERLKRYSNKIKQMEIVYLDGRVRYVNRKGLDKVKSINKRENCEYKNDDIRENTCQCQYKPISVFRYMLNIALKVIFTCIILISTPFIANNITNMGVNGFICGIGSILLSYFIINFIWIFFK